MPFTKVKSTEMIYHLNGESWNLYTLKEMVRQMEEDGFTPESEVNIDFKNNAVKVTLVSER